MMKEIIHVKEMKKAVKIHYSPQQILFYIIGVGLMPLGVVLTINAHLGAGGYDALNFALADRLSINTSYAIYATAFLALFITAYIRKGFPRVTTFISSFFIGLTTDFWKVVCEGLQGTTTILSVFMMLGGITVIGFAVASYMLSGLPTNPTDDLIVACKERGWTIWISKVTMDVICVMIAFILGGEIGVGTIIVTVILGPVINVFYQLMSRIKRTSY